MLGGQIDRWTDGQTDRQKYESIVSQIDGQTVGLIYRNMNEQIERWTDGWTDN